MRSDKDNSSIDFWTREIQTKGSDAVASILVSKLGTPAADNIQMAMVKFHKGQDAGRAKSKTPPNSEIFEATNKLIIVSRKALIIASIALGVSVVALILSVINFFR